MTLYLNLGTIFSINKGKAIRDSPVKEKDSTMKKATMITVFIFLTATFFSCSSLQTKQGQGTAVGTGAGAGIGALLGQLIGGNTESTLIGAAAGAALGGLAGNQFGKYMDQQEKELSNAIAASESASLRREQDILRATLKGGSYFDFDSSRLRANVYPELNRISTILIKYPQTYLEVGGHTDTKGSEEYNQMLSERRAAAVANQLIRNGVDAQRIRVVGYGESQLISSNDAMNRRVEIIIMPQAG